MTTETVVLVHGLWVSGIAMALMRRRIGRCGYRAELFSYPSLRLALPENVDRLARFCRGLGERPLHFVAHSLGGVMVLRLLERADAPRVGRVVLIGAPVSGSHAARRLRRLPGGRLALGRSMVECMNPEHARAPGACEIGVIAGTLPVGMGRIVAPDLPLPNDGAVTVGETRLPGARDTIALNVSHSGMLVSRAVAHQICAFLRDGAFLKDEGGRQKAEV